MWNNVDKWYSTGSVHWEITQNAIFFDKTMSWVKFYELTKQNYELTNTSHNHNLNVIL